MMNPLAKSKQLSPSRQYTSSTAPLLLCTSMMSISRPRFLGFTLSRGGCCCCCGCCCIWSNASSWLRRWCCQPANSLLTLSSNLDEEQPVPRQDCSSCSCCGTGPACRPAASGNELSVRFPDGNAVLSSVPTWLVRRKYSMLCRTGEF